MSEKKIYYKTPRGIFLFPKLTTPDTRFNPEGIYEVRIILEPSDARNALLQTIVDQAADALKIAQSEHPKLKTIGKANYPFKKETNEDGVLTGNIIVHAKMKAKVTPKDGSEAWTQRPNLFDSQNNLIDPKSISPWTGTIGIISFEIIPFFRATGPDAGVTLRLKAAQIIKLSEGKGQTAEDYGFEPEADGFYAENATTGSDTGMDARPEPPERDEDDLPF